MAVVFAASALALCPGDARACSCGVPPANELRVGDGRIPSNAAGVTWWFSGYAGLPLESLVTLERWEGQQLQRVNAIVEGAPGEIYVIRPAEPWSEGERYRISVDAGPKFLAEGRFRTVEFEVSEPLEGGELTLVQQTQGIRQQLSMAYFSGSGCGGSFDAAFVDVVVSSRLDRFPQGMLFFETYVDDQPWRPREGLCEAVEPGTSWVGRGRDRIAALCSAPAEPGLGLSLNPGAHRVRMEARLPGTDVVFRSDETSLVLSCKDDDEGANGGMPSAAGPFAAGSAMDVSEAETPRQTSERGCALSSSSNEARRHHGALALLALALFGVQRRRE